MLTLDVGRAMASAAVQLESFETVESVGVPFENLIFFLSCPFPIIDARARAHTTDK